MLSNLSRLRSPALLIILAFLAAFLCSSVGAPAGGHAPQQAQKHDPDGHDKHDAKKDDGHAAGKEPSIIDRLFLHVLDDYEIHLFETIWPHYIPLPKIFGRQITKFMVLEVIAALLIIVIYVPMARRLRSGEPARGGFDNAFEVLLTFVRDHIAKPSIGEERADRYVPFLWTMFLFILFNNLLGMFPFLGSPTASIFVTGALAIVVFFAIHGSAIVEMAFASEHGHGHDNHGHDGHGQAHSHDGGTATPQAAQPSLLTGAGRYIQSIWPQIDLPNWPIGLPIKTLIFCLEGMGVLVRNGVLAIRLFANMFAGHMVLAMILLFIDMAAHLNPIVWGTITLSSVAGILAMSLLELFVAFLQAYIFTFLTALFMGMAMHPQH
jgi:F-type H+-transporting ATPase subunit a